jgi:F0F1-type ATP synthase assembly protein I
MKRRLLSGQKTAIVQGILCIVVILVVLQLWLFTATMEAYLGGESAIILPAAIASLICLGLNSGLLLYLYKLDQR